MCNAIANKFKVVFSTLLFGCYVDAYWPSEKSPSTVIYKTASCKWQINSLKVTYSARFPSTENVSM